VQNLKDYSFVKLLSFEWNHKEDGFPTTALSILEVLREKSPLLERLVLIDGGSVDGGFRELWTVNDYGMWTESLPSLSPPHKFSDLLLEFASKMTHMTCCLITFEQLAVDLMKEVEERIEKEVVAERPSLWFYLDRKIPKAPEGGVPSVHFHEIVEPVSFVFPRL